MERSRRGTWRLSQSKNNPAITQFFSYSLGEGKRLFVLKPKTGKTHQLRVALKSLGSPIINDRLYGNTVKESNIETLGINLHAFTIRFIYQKKEYIYQHYPEHWLESEQEILLKGPISKPWELPWPVIA